MLKMEQGKISVVIHTYNSELHLRRVLESVREFDEVVVCDMGSTDGTLPLAAEYGCKVVMHPKIPIVEPARNFAIRAATHPWVLIVDSDELVQPALREYLYRLVGSENPPNAVRMARKNYFMGRWMHGQYPDYILRFFRKELVDWPAEIHRQPAIPGVTVTLPARRRALAFIPLVNPRVADWVAKDNLYTSQEVEKRRGQRVSWLGLLFAPWWRFVRAYLLKGGWRDGKPGYIYARMLALYKFYTLAKMQEAQYGRDDWDEELRGL